MTLTPNATTDLVVNGAAASVRSDHPHLLAALREELGVTSPKDGCSPSGQCGACTVLLDGKPIQSCLVSMDKAAGKAVTTLEGFDPAERDRLANAFAVTGALQCGFCTPGILVRTKALLDQKGADLDHQTMAGRLGGHLCRCTGYTKIFEAIEMLRDGGVAMAQLPSGIGKDGIKYEAASLALGDRGYVDDMRVPGMLHAALRLADHARADVMAIDTSAALAVEGVTAVYTAADIPGALRVGIIHTDWPVMIPVGGRTAYLGDVLAVVVADTVATAGRPPGRSRSTTTSTNPSPTWTGPSHPTRTRCGVSTATCCRAASTPGATSTPPWPPPPTSSPRPSSPSGSSTPSSSPSRPWPSPAPTGA
jgi:aldehyde oxidoreductase